MPIADRLFFRRLVQILEAKRNKHLNGLVRQHFPKGKTDFTKVTQAELDEVERMLNHRPRKRLDWHSPAKAFNGGKPLN
ncbi:hypothetical protein GZH52_07915 [Crenobacter sp. HX-7-9]|uniref:Mobile element protein n=1 Tax=Crenobacter caeni TaxID=2705474 RepID=A0A6B2KS10_9NEIS|nr:hypothetical protein [Crenobacter caeni]